MLGIRPPHRPPSTRRRSPPTGHHPPPTGHRPSPTRHRPPRSESDSIHLLLSRLTKVTTAIEKERKERFTECE